MGAPTNQTSNSRTRFRSVAWVCFAALILPLIAWFAFGGRTFVAPPPAPQASSNAAVSPLSTTGATRASSPAPLAPRRAEAPAPSAVLSGKVVDPTGSPVAAATVTCRAEREIVALTDANGRFELSSEATGCRTFATHPLFGPSEPVWLAIGADNTFRLTASGAVSGIVVDEQGAALPKYLLAIESFVAAASEADAPTQLGRTLRVDDSSGAFLWQGLMPGSYVLAASAAERPPARSSRFAIEVGRTTAGVRIVLLRGAKLTGVVTDADSKRPVEGATVGLDGASFPGASAVAEVKTDGSGAYALSGVPPGPFSVRVAHEAYVTLIKSGLSTQGAPSVRHDLVIRARSDGGDQIEASGTGLLLGDGPTGLFVVAALPGGTADRAGVKPGDRVLRIDGGPTEGLTAPESMQRVACREGARLGLSVAREKLGTLELVIPCEKIVQ